MLKITVSSENSIHQERAKSKFRSLNDNQNRGECLRWVARTIALIPVGVEHEECRLFDRKKWHSWVRIEALICTSIIQLTSAGLDSP